MSEELRCSFCNKRQKEVKKLIAGPRVYICEQCVAICVDILQEDGIIARVGFHIAQRAADRACENLRVGGTLIESGELPAAAIGVRGTVVETLRGLLALGGTSGADSWPETKVLTTGLANFPDLARLLHEKDRTHVILRLVLDKALLRREEVEEAREAAQAMLKTLQEKLAEAG